MRKSEKIAQVFEVNDQFSPTKASLYLLASLFNNNSFFDTSIETIIDASNFLSLTNNTQRIFFTDEEVGYSGAGYLIYPTSVYSSIITEDFNIIYYPIKNNGNNTIYVRIKDISGVGNCNVNVYLDSELKLSTNIITGVDWQWAFLGTISIGNSNIHNLGVRLITNGIALDQVAINLAGGLPGTEDALAQTVSPYITAHLNVYNTDINLFPTTSLFINDFKTSLSEISQDGWYNFDINFIDSSIIFNFVGSYALVLSVSGSNNKNYISWEEKDSEDNVSEPSAYK